MRQFISGHTMRLNMELRGNLIRSQLYDRLGEPLFENFAGVQAQLEKLLDEWGNGDDEHESEEPPGREWIEISPPHMAARSIM